LGEEDEDEKEDDDFKEDGKIMYLDELGGFDEGYDDGDEPLEEDDDVLADE
jgi:hypothetical protein